MKDRIISIVKDYFSPLSTLRDFAPPVVALALNVAAWWYICATSDVVQILILPWSMGQAFGGWAR